MLQAMSLELLPKLFYHFLSYCKHTQKEKTKCSKQCPEML